MAHYIFDGRRSVLRERLPGELLLYGEAAACHQEKKDRD